VLFFSAFFRAGIFFVPAFFIWIFPCGPSFLAYRFLSYFLPRTVPYRLLCRFSAILIRADFFFAPFSLNLLASR